MPLLDRRVEFDPKSRSFPIRTLIQAKQPRSYTWSCTAHLDQGQEGACVGHAFAHDIAARPKVRPADSVLAFRLYRYAQQLDEWEGGSYSGTSVLAGAKAVQRLGYVREYRWAFSLDETLLAIGYTGPVVLGLNWYGGMWNPDDKGFIHVTGSLSGGHAILAHGVSLKSESVLLRNSWGQSWGVNGGCRISFTDLDRLLHEDGEACVPVGRR